MSDTRTYYCDTISGAVECYQHAPAPNHRPEIGGLAAMATRNHTYERHGDARGRKVTRELNVWRHAKRRCFDEKNPTYPYYGGRGITMCDRWRNSYMAFLDDMGRCPQGLTLERKNNDGDYEPGNCVWATRTEQALNRRSNIHLDAAHVIRLLMAGMGLKEIGLLFGCSRRPIRELMHAHGLAFTAGRRLVQR